MNPATGYHIRHTLVNYSHLLTLPEDRQQKIKELTAEFNKLGYIDVTTSIGPDQWRRTSDKQRQKISEIAVKAFEIESQIKQLLKSEDQLQKEATEAATELKQKQINQIKNRINQIEQFLKRKLESNRPNPTKKEYQELQQQLSTLTHSLNFPNSINN